MTPELWQKTKELFQAALEVQPERRLEFVREATRDDEALRAEVEGLLLADSETSHIVDRSVFGIVADLISGGPHDESDMIGRSLGAYRIVREIGRGGMGEVYLAEDTRLDRLVAVKVLLAGSHYDPERVRRFRREARAASALNHPSIVTIHEVGEEEGRQYIVTEYIAGSTLRSLLQSGAGLRDAINITIQVANALAAAHTAGIVHRDIKPENIMVRPDGYVKVLDFGLAKLGERVPAGDRAEMSVTTSPGVVMGTASYMSPEQVRGQEVDERTDVFALGVVLYELVAGRKPFDGETPSDIIASILTRDPEPLDRIASGVPPKLQLIIDRSLAKEREARYRSITEMAVDLTELQTELQSGSSASESKPESRDGSTRSLGDSRRSTSFPEQSAVTSILSPKAAGSKVTVIRRAVVPTLGALITIAILIVIAVRFHVLRAEPAHPLESLAVLPFRPIVPDRGDEALEMGIADTLITRLSNLKGIVVRPLSAVHRSTAAQSGDAAAAGRELKVQAVLEGGIQKADGRIRVTARLLNVADGKPLWTGQFDEQWTDIFAVQDAIARRVAADLKLTLSGEEKGDLTRNYTAKPEAYQLYLTGRYHWNKRSSEGIRKSIESFRQALDVDDGYALAYVGLADAYSTLGSYHMVPGREAFPIARASAERALRIDDRLAEAHASMGKIITDYYWEEWQAAEIEFQRAIELKPNYANSHLWYSIFLANSGRFSEAVDEGNRSLDLDYLSPVASTQMGQVYYRARRYGEAISELNRTLDLEPRFIAARIYLGLTYAAQGQYDRALAELQKGRDTAPDNGDFIALLGCVNGMAGRLDQAQRYQRELDELAKRSYVSPFDEVSSHLGIHDFDAAFKWIDECYDQRDPLLVGLKTDPLFDVIRRDLRFDQMLKRVGIWP